MRYSAMAHTDTTGYVDECQLMLSQEDNDSNNLKKTSNFKRQLITGRGVIEEWRETLRTK